MAQRLVDTYRLDETVEVFFQDEVAEEWRPARVVRPCSIRASG